MSELKMPQEKPPGILFLAKTSGKNRLITLLCGLVVSGSNYLKWSFSCGTK